VILAAALRTFASNGYDGAAMDEIAAAAGISKAVVYDHVPSKRELYLQLLESIRQDLERTVEAALARRSSATSRSIPRAAGCCCSSCRGRTSRRSAASWRNAPPAGWRRRSAAIRGCSTATRSACGSS
jgi:AcrR family transcriptional regulator